MTLLPRIIATRVMTGLTGVIKRFLESYSFVLMADFPFFLSSRLLVCTGGS